MILLHTFKNSALGLQKSTPLSRIRHGVAVLLSEFDGQIVDPR